MNNQYESLESYVDVSETKVVVKSPRDIVNDIKQVMVQYMEHQECMVAVSLDGGNHVIAINFISLGLSNKCQCSPTIVFRNAIKDNAVSIILAHNHPSGNIQASNEDIETTKTLVECGKLLDIAVLDHLILTKSNGWSSIRAIKPILF